MAIETFYWFTTGGLFTGLYANAVRKYPLMRKPQLHLVCTGVGALIGYQAHLKQEEIREKLPKAKQRYYDKCARQIQEREEAAAM
eukprot:m.333283 g.333283  ORF g.333283 m.333283 type:complete len:85 (+) comp17108_c0_seq1:30-284(+)